MRSDNYHRKRLFSCLLIACLLPAVSGCQRSANVPLKIGIFVVTRGQETIRLPLVAVNAAPLEQAKANLVNHVRSTRPELEKIEKSLQSLVDERQALVQKEAQAEAALREATVDRANALDAVLEFKPEKSPFNSGSWAKVVQQLIDKVAEKGDATRSAALQARGQGDEATAKKKSEEGFALNVLVQRHVALVNKRIAAQTKPDELLLELLDFYGGEEFKDFPEEQAAALKAIRSLRDLVEKRSQSLRLLDELKQVAAECEKQVTQLQEQFNTVRRAIHRLEVDADLLRNEAGEQKSIKHCFAVLPPPLVSKPTGPDGVATLELQNDQKWVLWAHSTRQVAEKTEFYFWIVEAPDLRQWEVEETFFLSNENLSELDSLPKFLEASW